MTIPTEKKTIKINPELFQLSNNKNKGGRTKKSTQGEPNNSEIKMKNKKELSEAKSNTLKRNILKVIRAKQQDEYKRLFSKPTKTKENNTNNIHPIEQKFNKDFDNSLQYLANLEQKVNEENLIKKAQPSMNHTFRNYPPIQPQLMQMPPQMPPQMPAQMPAGDPFVLSELPSEFDIIPPSVETSSPRIQLQPPPPPQIQQNRPTNIFTQHPGYGCLKGGTIPTYRTLKNKQIPVDIPKQQSQIEKQEIQPLITETAKITEVKRKLAIHSDNQKQYKKIRNAKRRKIYKRTYHVGKSKTAPKIGCLISNKTIRQKIQQTAYDLKHTNMKDVRKFLLKRGFIKIGTTAPNDVLRKMYESVAMVCGEVHNHNPDNLLFNFVNDKEDV